MTRLTPKPSPSPGRAPKVRHRAVTSRREREAAVARQAGLEPHLSLPAVAEILDLSPDGLRNKLESGRAPELKATKIFGRWRVPVSAIKALLSNGQGGGS